VVGGRSVGVPGTVRLMEDAHKRFGRLPWARLFEPAITLAEEGFAISPRLNGLLSQEQFLARDTVAKAYFYEAGGAAKAVGTKLQNPAFAQTLRTLAEKGAAAFYSGPLADDIVATVTGHAGNPGDMTLDDLRGYAVVEREPVCGKYRVYTICGMGPPSSGAIAVQQILSVLETRDLARAYYNPRLALAGVIVNRVERTVEHRRGLAEITSYFGGDLVWSPHLPKRTALQEGARRGVPLAEVHGRAARELGREFAELASRIKLGRGRA